MSARGGLAVLVALATLTVFVVRAVTADSPITIVGTAYGPCEAHPSSTVEVSVDGEHIGSGHLVVSRWAQRCGGTISISGLESAEEYTLDAGPLYAFVRGGSVYDGMTITLRSG